MCCSKNDNYDLYENKPDITLFTHSQKNNVNFSSNVTNFENNKNNIESYKINLKDENVEKNKSNNEIIEIITDVYKNTTNDEKTIDIDEPSNIYVLTNDFSNDNKNIKSKNNEVPLNNENKPNLNLDNKEIDYKNKKENEINLIKQSLKPVFTIKISPPIKKTNLSVDNQNSKLKHVKTKIENKLHKSQNIKIKNNITDKVRLLEQLMVKKLLNNEEQNNNEYIKGNNYEIINQKPIINKIKKKKKLDLFE